MASTSPAVSPRTQTSASQPQPSAANGPTRGPTRWNIIFTPGGSSVIKDNLIRVYENREYRIYGAFLTGVTAVRSGLEILPSIGKLLLNTATWFVDVTSPRGDGFMIIGRDFADILHCVKTTIALPFFSIAGLIFPADVFGLFENMPGIQTKVEIFDERAILDQVKAKRASEERNLTAAEGELAEIQKELGETDEALTATKAELEKVQQQIAGSKDDAAAATGLRTQVRDLTADIVKLRDEERTVSSTLAGIRADIARLGSELEGAKRNNTSALQSLERERLAKEEDLQRIRDQIKQTGERQVAVQADFDRLSAVVKDLTPKAAALRAEVEKIETAKPGLLAQEKELLARIQGHKAELADLEAQVNAARESTRRELTTLSQSIATQQTALDQNEAKLERLKREQTALDARWAGLNEQCRELEFTTIHGLNELKKAREADMQTLEKQKTALGDEIAAQTETLRAANEAVKKDEARVAELKAAITGFEQAAGNFRDKVLPDLERQSTELADRKAALEREVSAEQTKLDTAKTTHADTRRELEGVARNLEAKRAEQASLEQTLARIQAAWKGAPVSSPAADGSSSAEQTIAALQQQLQALGTSISEKTGQDAALTASVAEKESALREKTEAVARLTGEASSLDSKVGGLKGQAADLNTRLSRLNDDIARLETKEKTLKEQNAALDGQVKTSTASLEKIAAQHKELETQLRAATERKAAAEKDLTGLSDQIAAAKRTQAEIQSVIDGLKPSIESLRKTLSELEGEKARLDAALPGLRTEEQALTRQIAEGKQELAGLKETLARAHEAHTAEMRTLEEARTRLTDEKGRLETENQAKIAARNALQLELDGLTASTAALRGQEATLNDTVRTALEAQQAAIARSAQEAEALKALQTQAKAAAAEVGALSQQSTALTEANRKLQAEFETRRAAFEEELRQREQAAVTALESKLQEIRLRSPAKAKLDSPAGKTAASVPPTPGTVAEDLTTVSAKLRQKERELQRAEKAVLDKRAELRSIEEECTTYSEQLQAKLATVKEALARVNTEKAQAEQALAATMSEADYAALIKRRTEELTKLRIDRTRIEGQVKKLRTEREAGDSATAAATPAKKMATNGGTDTEVKK